MGAVFTPRIGTEVAIGLVDGDITFTMPGLHSAHHCTHEFMPAGSAAVDLPALPNTARAAHYRTDSVAEQALQYEDYRQQHPDGAEARS